MSFAHRTSAVLRFALTTSLVWGVLTAIVVSFLGLTAQAYPGFIRAALSFGLTAGMAAFVISFFGGALLAGAISLWPRTKDGNSISLWWAGTLGTVCGIALPLMLFVGAWIIDRRPPSPSDLPEFLGLAVSGGLFGGITGVLFAAISRRGALSPAPDVPRIDAGDA